MAGLVRPTQSGRWRRRGVVGRWSWIAVCWGWWLEPAHFARATSSFSRLAPAGWVARRKYIHLHQGKIGAHWFTVQSSKYPVTTKLNATLALELMATVTWPPASTKPRVG